MKTYSLLQPQISKHLPQDTQYRGHLGVPQNRSVSTEVSALENYALESLSVVLE